MSNTAWPDDTELSTDLPPTAQSPPAAPAKAPGKRVSISISLHSDDVEISGAASTIVDVKSLQEESGTDPVLAPTEKLRAKKPRRLTIGACILYMCAPASLLSVRIFAWISCTCSPHSFNGRSKR
jgi:hypothetical protein